AIFATANSLSDNGIQLLAVKGRSEALNGHKLFERWNSISRITVFDEGQGIQKRWGPSVDVPIERTIKQRLTQIDGLAGTYSYQWDGNIDSLRFLKYDVTNIGYHLPGLSKAVIIGVGGGRDLLAAKLYGLADITGLDLNRILTQLLSVEPGFADFVGLHRLDGIRLVNDEARSWFSRTNERFDLIQMSLIDTWAATGAGAYTLSENRLYTLDAWRLFFDHLTD